RLFPYSVVQLPVGLFFPVQQREGTVHTVHTVHRCALPLVRGGVSDGRLGIGTVHTVPLTVHVGGVAGTDTDATLPLGSRAAVAVDADPGGDERGCDAGEVPPVVRTPAVWSLGGV